MKALLIIATTVAMSSIGFAADTAAPAAAPAAPAAAGPAAPAQAMMHAKGKHASVSDEAKAKCKAENKANKKGYVACLKAAK